MKHNIKLGDYMDALYDIKALLECQFDSLLGLSEHHIDSNHHMIFNQVIKDKINKLSTSIENEMEELRNSSGS